MANSRKAGLVLVGGYVEEKTRDATRTVAKSRGITFTDLLRELLEGIATPLSAPEPEPMHDMSEFPVRGEYFGVPLMDVPAALLLRLAKGGEHSGSPLGNYIEARREFLEKEAAHDRKRRAGR